MIGNTVLMSLREIRRNVLRSSLTVLQALTLAGGLTEYAKRKQIYILRNDHGKPTRPLALGVGAFAGVCSGAAQIGGPAVIAYWLGSTSPSAVIRANIILYFSISTAIAIVTYLAVGVLTLTVVKLAIAVGPFYGAGLFLGSRLFGVADETIFRRICYALIVIAVVVSLPILDGVIR